VGPGWEIELEAALRARVEQIEKGDKVEIPELATAKPPAARPLAPELNLCGYCGYQWSPRGERTAARCPNCQKRGWAHRDAWQCAECEKWVPENQRSEGVCADCEQKLVSGEPQ